MKKKIGDLTLREIKQHCRFELTGGMCEYCDFYHICYTKVSMLLYDLEQEIEVEENE